MGSRGYATGVHALVRGAVAVGALAVLGGPLWLPAAPPELPRSGEDADGRGSGARQCPPGTIPDSEAFAPRARACVRLPDDPSRGARLRRVAEPARGAAELRSSSAEEWIARMPERPSAFDAYQLPVDDAVDTSESSAEAGGPIRGLRLTLDEPSAVHVPELEGQIAPATVALVGELYGVTVVTLHRVQDAVAERMYAVVFGRLTTPAAGVVAGVELPAGATVGTAGGEDGPSELYLEVRRLAVGASVGPRLSSLVSAAVSTPVDPRNVMRLR